MIVAEIRKHYVQIMRQYIYTYIDTGASTHTYVMYVDINIGSQRQVLDPVRVEGQSVCVEYTCTFIYMKLT